MQPNATIHIKIISGPFDVNYYRIWNDGSACKTIIGLNDNRHTTIVTFYFLKFNVDDEFYRFHIEGTALTLTFLIII